MQDVYADLPTVRIREVAELTGFSPSTLRKYERLGLVLPYIDRPGGHRLYSQDDITWLCELKEFFRRESIAPHEVSRVLAELPARDRRIAAGAEHSGVASVPDSACWSTHAQDAERRRQCRTCPGLAARKSVLSYSRKNWAGPVFSLNQMAERLLFLREPIAESLFHALRSHLTWVRLYVESDNLSVNEVYPDSGMPAVMGDGGSAVAGGGRLTMPSSATPAGAEPLSEVRLPLRIGDTEQGYVALGLVDKSWPAAHQATLHFIQQLLSHRLTGMDRSEGARRLLSDASRRLATAVYEARSPLSALALHLDLAERYLKSEPDSERAARKLAEAKRFIVDTNRKLEAISDSTRSQLRTLPLERSTVDLAALVRDCCEPAMRLAASGGKTLRLRSTQALKGAWDEARLTNSLGSLLSWAVKCASTSDTIEVFATERRGKARVAIKPFHVMPQRTEPERKTGKKSGELPIGLMMIAIDLARQVAEAHDGALLFEVDDDARTNLVVELPMHEGERALTRAQGAGRQGKP